LPQNNAIILQNETSSMESGATKNERGFGKILSQVGLFERMTMFGSG